MKLTPKNAAVGMRVVVRRPQPGCPPIGTRGTLVAFDEYVRVAWDGAEQHSLYVGDRRYPSPGGYYYEQFDIDNGMFNFIDEAF